MIAMGTDAKISIKRSYKCFVGINKEGTLAGADANEIPVEKFPGVNNEVLCIVEKGSRRTVGTLVFGNRADATVWCREYPDFTPQECTISWEVAP